MASGSRAEPRPLRAQQERIQELPPNELLTRMIYETEVERVSFLLRSYLRARILKIQEHALFLARDEEAQSRLSEPERTFAAQYAALHQRHIDREAWEANDTARLPDNLKQITSVSHLASPPNIDAHVFCVATLVICFSVSGSRSVSPVAHASRSTCRW